MFFCIPKKEVPQDQRIKNYWQTILKIGINEKKITTYLSSQVKRDDYPDLEKFLMQKHRDNMTSHRELYESSNKIAEYGGLRQPELDCVLKALDEYSLTISLIRITLKNIHSHNSEEYIIRNLTL